MRFVPCAVALAFMLGACGGANEQKPWKVEMSNLDEALLSVWGSSESDVWAVGSDAGGGPLVQHFDGSQWSARATATQGDLCWVFGFKDGPVYMGGAGGSIVRYSNGIFEKMTTPG